MEEPRPLIFDEGLELGRDLDHDTGAGSGWRLPLWHLRNHEEETMTGTAT